MNENQCNWLKGGPRPCGTQFILPSAAIAIAVLFAGCRGVQTSGERQAREQARSVHAQYNPEARSKNLPELKAGASLEDYLHYAILNQPQVESAYYDWLASIERSHSLSSSLEMSFASDSS